MKAVLVYRQYALKNWGRKGQRKKISGQRRRGRINVMGAIRESDRSSCMFLY
jgi:hypothetical protein